MITFLETKQTAGGLYVEGFCDSTDTLPVSGICNGSKMEVFNLESNTVSEYRFAATSGEWIAVADSGSGGGGGGTAGFLRVTFTYYSSDESVVSDVLFDEIVAAYEAGQPILARLVKINGGIRALDEDLFTVVYFDLHDEVSGFSFMHTGVSDGDNIAYEEGVEWVPAEAEGPVYDWYQISGSSGPA